MFYRFVAVLVLLPSITLADDGSKVALVSNPFNEVLREAAQISGARLVGLTATGTITSTIAVSAVIPTDWSGEEVCLKIVSADGLYESFNAYTVSADWGGGTSELPYPTASPEALASIPTHLISGILLKGNCIENSKEAATVFWGSEQHTATRVLLNTARADETYLTFPDNPELPDILCGPVQATSRNAFDTACILPLELGGIEPLEAVVLSFKNGEMGQEERITLHLGQMQ